MEAVNAHPKSGNRKKFLWPVTGLALGVIAATNSIYVPRITLDAGIASLFATILLVLVISGTQTGARVGVLLAGLFLAIPCFVRAEALPRGLLMCLMAFPFAAAASL